MLFRWSLHFVILVQEVSKESQELMRKALEEVTSSTISIL